MKKNSSDGLTYSWHELLISMRFSVSLLTILAVASVIGTVLKQNEPYSNYVLEFGPFWFEVFKWLGVYNVYHSLWFLTILFFLVLATSLCILRNAPRFLLDMRAYREKISEKSLAAIKHSSSFVAEDLDANAVCAYLRSHGFRFKKHLRSDGGWVLAAKKGSVGKLGYFFAHIALVLICIGGLLDGNLPIKLGIISGWIVPETRDLPQNQVHGNSRLSANNRSFRGNVTIAENQSADVIFVTADNGYLVQELPFSITLKKFHIDYYSSGMPKLFASDIVVIDKASGKTTEATVRVNQPLKVDGISIYQSSFGDGASMLKFKVWNLAVPQSRPTEMSAVSLSTKRLHVNGLDYNLEVGELRVVNVEHLGKSKVGPRTFSQRMHDARAVKQDRHFGNQGPSISFKLRDSQGEALEFMHYMAPIQQDGASYLMAGVRKTVGAPFQYLRIPLDEEVSVERFMRLRAALLDPSSHNDVARRVMRKALNSGAISPILHNHLFESVKWVLSRFSESGLLGLEKFIEQRVPPDMRKSVRETYTKILQGAVLELMAMADEEAGLPPMKLGNDHYRFLLDSLVAVNAFQAYRAPVFLQLNGFEQVQASGLQVTRSPGKTVVYLGSGLLVLGILMMFYVRELRLWVRVRGSNIRVSMTSNRHNRDLDDDFTRHSQLIKQLVRGA